MRASSRTPAMPYGSRTPSCSSTANCCGRICSTCRSSGIATARAASITRSTSRELTSPPRTATIPWLLRPLICGPATPTTTEPTRTPEVFSASSTAALIASTVASILTTTPLRRPVHGAIPNPSVANCPSGSDSPTIAQTLLVPTSSPVSRFLIASPAPARLERNFSNRGLMLRVIKLDLMQPYDRESGRGQIERCYQVLASLPLLPHFDRSLKFGRRAFKINHHLGALALEEERRGAVVANAHLRNDFRQLRLSANQLGRVVDHLRSARVVERNPAQHRQVGLLAGRHRPAQLAATEQFVEAVVTLNDRDCTVTQIARIVRRRRLDSAPIKSHVSGPLDQHGGIVRGSRARGRNRIQNLVAIRAEICGRSESHRAAGGAESRHHAQHEKCAHHQPAHPRAPSCRRFISANRHPTTSPKTQIACYQSPTSLTSGSSQTPLCSFTLSRAMSISARTSAACAPPRFTIKFAC